MNNKTLVERFGDLLDKPKKVDNRTGNEIALDIIKRLELKV